MGKLRHLSLRAKSTRSKSGTNLSLECSENCLQAFLQKIGLQRRMSVHKMQKF